VFSFAIDAGDIPANPASRLKKRAREKARTHTLSDDDIRALWPAVIRSPLSHQTGLALRLALLTAVRASEIADARKDEFVDLDKPAKAAWIVPGDRTKNKQPHLVPLSRLALDAVKTALELSGSDYLFPGRRGDHINRHVLKVGMQRLTAKWSKPCGPHDLRRTVITWLAANGIASEIRESLLGHVRRSIEAKHYNVYDHAKEKRAALDRWARRIASLIA
jgi:integrase